jgi:hypothetical protein
MRFLRALGDTEGRTRLLPGDPLRARRLWRRTVPGYAAHDGLLDPASGGIFVSDGWGVTYASLRLRRYSLATGEEQAKARTGTGMRCATRLPGDTDLLVATDTKLFRLAAHDLTEVQRWDRRIPRYAASIAVRGDQAVLANWMDPRLGIVDLATGRVRHRDGPAMMRIVDGAPDPLLVSGTPPGGVARIDLAAGVVGETRPVPPLLDAAVDPDEPALWSIVGIRGTWSATKVTPGKPSSVLRRDWLDNRAPAEEWDLPAEGKTIVVGQREIWVGGGGAVVAIPRPVASAPPRVWRQPGREVIRWFDPDARIAVAIEERSDGPTAMLEAVRLD